MTPLVFNLGPTELLIILAIVLLLFGGARLAGLGKSTGRAIKEFKEETRSIRDRDEPARTEPEPPAANTSSYQQPPPTNVDDASTSEPRRDT